MFKKSFLAIMLVAVGIFTFGTAQADQVNGLVSGSGLPLLPVGFNTYVNPGGVGDGLIYGYYNARGNVTLLKVVNTSSTSGIGAKVRFREGKNSNEILDFYICLSAMDEWSAWVYGDAKTGAAKLLVYDNDTPVFPDPDSTTAVTDNDVTNNLGKTFTMHDGSNGAKASITADDTKEGYFEILGNVSWNDTPGTKTISTPNQCGKAVLTASAWQDTGINDTPTVPQLYAPNNVLFGNAYVLDFVDGKGTYSYNATALGNWLQSPLQGKLSAESTPTLANATDGLSGINYVLTKARQYAVYDIETALAGGTTIINTFPTKRLSIENIAANGPFRDDATANIDGTISNRCEKVTVTVWDDKEHTLTSGHCTTSPCQPLVVDTFKCNEVSLFVVGTGKTALISNSTLVDANIDTQGTNSAPYQYGWISEDFTTNATGIAGRHTTVRSAQTNGLPVIGFELQGISSAYFSHMLPLRFDNEFGTVGTTIQ